MFVCNVCSSSFHEYGLPLFCGCVSEENAIGLIGHDNKGMVIEWVQQGLIDPYTICDSLNGWCVYTEAKALDLDDFCNACLAVAPAPDFVFHSGQGIAPTLYQSSYDSGSEPFALENDQPNYDSDSDSDSDSDLNCFKRLSNENVVVQFTAV
jgi:hypothetical protein